MNFQIVIDFSEMLLFKIVVSYYNACVKMCRIMETYLTLLHEKIIKKEGMYNENEKRSSVAVKFFDGIFVTYGNHQNVGICR